MCEAELMNIELSKQNKRSETCHHQENLELLKIR